MKSDNLFKDLNSYISSNKNTKPSVSVIPFCEIQNSFQYVGAQFFEDNILKISFDDKKPIENTIYDTFYRDCY